MKIKAVWIIDENYIVPAYLSIISFLRTVQIPVVVAYCGEKGVKKASSLFTAIHESISFEIFDTPKEFQNDLRKDTITNRLARMHYAGSSNNDVILLLDADTLFTEQSTELLASIASEYNRNDSLIYGVLDAKMAYRDYLYFRTTDENDRDVVVPHLEQKDIYGNVYGENWWHLLKGPSINNGVVAFYNCKEIIENWKEYYLRGLQYNKVNPGDDQLPLAAAIYKTSQKVITLSEKFNSKGRVFGDYIIYHAFSSIWKMQVISAYNGEKGVSDFADLAKRFLPSVPQQLLSEFIRKQKKVRPYLFRQLGGKFGFQHLYEDIISGLDKGTVVEVGLNRGKSTCFMIELIRNKRKDIRFLAIETNHENSKKLEPFYRIVDCFGLKKYVDFLDFRSDQIQSRINENLDFVFLNLGLNYNMLIENLELWYSKLKPGGILAGYDYTSQLGLNYGDTCATYDFCSKRNLSLRISFNIFIIEKPRAKHSRIESIDTTLALNEPSVKL